MKGWGSDVRFIYLNNFYDFNNFFDYCNVGFFDLRADV